MSFDTVTYIEWLKSLPRSDTEYVNAKCPVCGSEGIEYQYFSFSADVFGWKLVWCPHCKTGIRVSRVRVPEGEGVLRDEIEQEEFVKKHRYIRLIS